LGQKSSTINQVKSIQKLETFIKIQQNICIRCREPGCGSFDGGIWLPWYLLNTMVTDERFL